MVTVLIPLWGMIGIWTDRFGCVHASPSRLNVTEGSVVTFVDSTKYGSSGGFLHLCIEPSMTIESCKGVQCYLRPVSSSILCVLPDDDGRAGTSRF